MVRIGALVPTRDFDYAKSESEDGLWSYNPARALGKDVLGASGAAVGDFFYPNCTTDYMMDTGIRGPQAAQGALVAAIYAKTAARDTNDRIQRSLRSVRPYGGTPIASALDECTTPSAEIPRWQTSAAAMLARTSS